MTHHPDHEVELFRTEGGYEVYVDLPGFEREDLRVRWHDGRLHVEAERNDDGSTRVYNRQLALPHRIDPEGIAATYEDGVLDVRLPVREEESRPGHEIEIER